jgi:hypothetical protein
VADGVDVLVPGERHLDHRVAGVVGRVDVELAQAAQDTIGLAEDLVAGDVAALVVHFQSDERRRQGSHR